LPNLKEVESGDLVRLPSKQSHSKAARMDLSWLISGFVLIGSVCNAAAAAFRLFAVIFERRREGGGH
jgi:hypothetical protein